MRSYSFFTIFLLCLAIIGIDALAYYWLQSITQFLGSSELRTVINVLFWIFTFGLVTAILTLKLRMDAIPVERKQSVISYLYGLTISSFIPKILFIIIISILHFSNYFFSETESLIVVPVFGLIAGFLPFFTIVYAIFGARYHFKVNTVKVKAECLPESFSGLKVVHISDLHLGSFGFRYHIFEKAVNMINDLHPDLIFFTGDLVNNYAWELRGWEPILGKMKAERGKFSVLGNHDYGDYSQWETETEKQENFDYIKKFHKNVGFHLLMNESAKFTIGDQTIAIIGVENWGKPPFKQYGDLDKALHNVRDIPFKILLTHDPTHWDAAVVGQTDITLTLSGHTHGMQAGVSIGNRQWSPIQLKYKQWSGLYKNKLQQLYVNRGLGWLGFPGRIGMRPEITLIELVKKYPR